MMFAIILDGNNGLRTREKLPELAGLNENGQKTQKWGISRSDPNEIFVFLHIPNRLVETISER